MKAMGLIIGKGAPNRCKDGSATMCAIALTKELGLIRIYPIRIEHKVRVWDWVDIEAEPSKTDNRRESWKLTSINVIGAISDRDEKAAILDACILRSSNIDPIDYQDESRSSIAIVRGEIFYPYITWGQLEQPPENYESEDAWITCQVEYAHKPYVHWKSHAGKKHHSHIVAHEAYEWMRHEPTKPHSLFDNMKLINPDYMNWFVLGNMKNRRNVWVIVHVHRLKMPVNFFMQHSFAAQAGKGLDWPYSKQEAENAKRAEDPQMSLIFTTGDTDQLTHGNMISTK